ncbi:hypothetical protein, partial [Pantoea dispersa]
MPTSFDRDYYTHTHLPLALVLSTAALVAAAPARAMLHYEGIAYAADSKQVLYRESHWVRDDGARVVLYQCADGSAFARKRVDDGSAAPDFELVDAPTHGRNCVRRSGGGREMFSQAKGQAERRAPLPKR